MIDFLCIGTQKAATNRLMANLSSHPGIWTPRFIKELHYFDVVHLGSKPKAILKSYQRKGARIIANRPKFKPYFDQVTDPDFAFTDEWYAHVFSNRKANALAGECTSLYCALPDEGVAHVKRLCPNVRLIYLIRDPFSRMMYALRTKMDRLAITDGSQVEAFLDDATFLACGDYRANITRWESYFDPSAILYVPYGKMMKDPLTVMRNVEQHLGLSPYDEYPKLSVQNPPTKVDDKVFDDAMIQRINELVAPQEAFLAEKWGTEFMETIR